MIRLPSLRQAIAHRAYDLCRTELDMAESARLLTEVAATLPAPSGDAINGLRRPSQITSVGEKEPAMAIWVPGTQDLPQAGPSASPWIIRQLEELSELRASRAIVSAARMNGPPADVDVICVHRPGDGPLGLTVESISGAHGAIGLRLAMSPSAAAEESTVPWGARTFLTADLEIGRARQRNVLVETSDSELLCFLDAGDAVLGDTLHKLVTLMKDNQDLDIAFPMATCGPNRMTNVLIPEKRRLLTRAYLTRGFLVRRRWLEDIGGFSEDPYLEDLVDHAFWLRSASAGASVHLLRQIGFKLWPRKQEPGLATLDPARTRAAISSITEASRETTAASRPVALHE
jgi:hypothetical protein